MISSGLLGFPLTCDVVSQEDCRSICSRMLIFHETEIDCPSWWGSISQIAATSIGICADGSAPCSFHLRGVAPLLPNAAPSPHSINIPTWWFFDPVLALMMGHRYSCHYK